LSSCSMIGVHWIVGQAINNGNRESFFTNTKYKF